MGARAGAAGSWARGRRAQQACGADGRAAGGARGRLGERQQARGERQQARGARQQARGARQQARGARQQARGARSRRADTAWTSGGARQAHGAAGWAASAHLGVLNWAMLGFCAP